MVTRLRAAHSRGSSRRRRAGRGGGMHTACVPALISSSSRSVALTRCCSTLAPEPDGGPAAAGRFWACARGRFHARCWPELPVELDRRELDRRELPVPVAVAELPEREREDMEPLRGVAPRTPRGAGASSRRARTTWR